MKNNPTRKPVRLLILLLISGVILLGGIGIWAVYKPTKVKNSQSKISAEKAELEEKLRLLRNKLQTENDSSNKLKIEAEIKKTEQGIKNLGDLNNPNPNPNPPTKNPSPGSDPNSNPPTNNQGPNNPKPNPENNDNNKENQLTEARQKLLAKIKTESEKNLTISPSKIQEYNQKVGVASQAELVNLEKEFFDFIKNFKPTDQPPPGNPPRKNIPITKGSTNWDWETNNDLLKLTKQEPEYLTTPPLLISSAGTEYRDLIISANILPRGSALMTEADGELKRQGIKKIIHAITGSQTKKPGEKDFGNFLITGQLTIRSIQNSIILAERDNQPKIAIPYLGGEYWDMGDDIYFTAEKIVHGALGQRSKNLEVIFVVSPQKKTNVRSWMTGFEEAKLSEIFQKKLDNYKTKYPGKAQNVKIVEGDITDFSCHQAPVIVNHLNMEGKLDGKLSQAIVAKLGKSWKQMEDDIKSKTTEFNKLFSDS